MNRYPLYIGLAVLVVLLSIAPFFISSYYVGLLILTLIYGIFAMSLDVLTGYAGLPSLGHAAFFGVSAYVVAIINVKLFHNFAVEFLTGLAAAAIIAAIFGLLALRTRGIYFLMVTLALSMLLWALASRWAGMTGGDDGLTGVSRPDLSPILWNLRTTTHYYYFVLIVFVIATILMYSLVRSSFGITLLGIQENETRMGCLGYNTWAYRYIAFIVSGVFAGLAGILSVYYNRFVSPVELGVITSSKVLLMLILGGTGTLFGPAIAAGIIVFLENLVSGITERWLSVLGLIYVLVIFFTRKGIYRPLKRFVRRIGIS
jgi:branched-chain amino acid transport system permease protein